MCPNKIEVTQWLSKAVLVANPKMAVDMLLADVSTQEQRDLFMGGWGSFGFMLEPEVPCPTSKSAS